MLSYPARIEIKTTDQSLLTDLKAENIPDLKYYYRSFTCDSADWVPPAVKILTYIVETSKDLSLSLFLHGFISAS